LARSINADCAAVRSPEPIALSRATRFLAASLLRDAVPSVLVPAGAEAGGAGEFCKVVNAACAADMLPLESALSTLVRKVPMGSSPFVLCGEFCST
jgi:hypothetical protein